MLRAGKLPPIRAYFVIAFGDAFIFTFGENILILFQTDEAALSAAQLLALTAVYRAVIMICEVPTGVVADTMGRRISVCAGFVLLGLGLLISGVRAEFSTLLVGEITLGLGYTFLSGAHQAWIADEIGVEEANSIYVRTAQISLWLWAAAVPLSVILSAWHINLPMLIAGVALVILGGLLFRLMPESGFPRSGDDKLTSASITAGMRKTYLDGVRTVRGRSLLVTILAISAFYGIVGLGFQRLWLLHFNENIGYPDILHLGPVGWFGVLRVASSLLGVVMLELVRRRGANMMSDHKSVTRSLFLINALQMSSILLLAMTANFEIAFAAYCLTFALSFAYDPYQIAWINQNVESNVRATVISMNTQSESLGRIVGAPVIAGVSAISSVRAALALAGSAMVVPLLLYFRASGQGQVIKEEEPDSDRRF